MPSKFIIMLGWLACLGVCSSLRAQSPVAAGLQLILAQNPLAEDSPPPPAPVRAAAPANSAAYGFSLLANVAITGYQRYISSQDTPSCNFTPSCSHFAQQAIQQDGLLIGLLLTFDRLQRCNGRNVQYYPVDPATGLCIDPLAQYRWSTP